MDLELGLYLLTLMVGWSMGFILASMLHRRKDLRCRTCRKRVQSSVSILSPVDKVTTLASIPLCQDCMMKFMVGDTEADV